MKRAMRFIHPDEIIREEVIMSNDLTITKAAELVGIFRQTLQIS
jgi:plasmid maintenance system antidote protein VapI